MNILLVDNYDSFTHNLLHLLEAEAATVKVIRNDHPSLNDVSAYDGIVISPGPGSPEDVNYFGHNANIIANEGGKGTPILGICLGFQGIYHAFGGKLKVSDEPVHGKVSKIDIVGNNPLFVNVPNQTPVMRYHSICADLDQPIPSCLHLSAYVTEKNQQTLMAIEHKDHPIYGLQFHPESFATRHGQLLIRNFLTICQQKLLEKLPL